MSTGEGTHPSSSVDFVIDGHLDLAAIAFVHGRDLTLSAAEIRRKEQRATKEATVSFPDLHRGRVAIVFATLWAMPRRLDIGVGPIDVQSAGMQPYTTPEEAEAEALRQIDLYRRWADDGLVRLIDSKASLAPHLQAWHEDRTVGLVLLMEGADPIVRPDDLPMWWDRGLRIVGPAWGRTRYAGGTGSPGGLTAEGRELIAGMRSLGIALDVSHLAEQAFWEALEIGSHAVIASHVGARALVDGDRQLSDAMLSAIAERDGMVGLVLYNRFIDAEWRTAPVRISQQLRAHAEHMAKLVGWDRLAIGSDLDGGGGVLDAPEEIDTVADLWKVGIVAPPEQRAGVLGGNWLRFLKATLP